MISKDELLNKMKGNPITLGWDVIVAYERKQINLLFEQQYVNKVANGEHFDEINAEKEYVSSTVIFEKLLLGPPLISFENSSIESSRATVRLNFVSGTVKELNSNGNVVQHQQVLPGHDYYITLNVDLVAVEGTVDQKGTVIINLSEGSIKELNLLNLQNAEVQKFFEEIIAKKTVIYELGKISDMGGEGLTPERFIIRTQPAPGAKNKSSDNYGSGAVILLIETAYADKSEPGLLPSDGSLPYLIPNEYSGTIIVSNRVVVAKIIKKELEENIYTSPGYPISLDVVNNPGSGSTTEAALKFTRGKLIGNYINLDIFIRNGSITIGKYSIWTGTYSIDKKEIIKHFINLNLDYESMECIISDDRIKIGGTKFNDDGNYNFHPMIIPTAGFTEFTYLPQQPLAIEPTNFGLIDYITLKPEVIGDVVVFSVEKYMPVSNMNLQWPNEDPMPENLFEEFKAYFEAEIKNGIVKNILNAMNIYVEPINTFAVNHLLFPEMNILQLKNVHIPSDMVIFGDIDDSNTAFRINPLQSIMLVGESRTFNVIPAQKDITWTVETPQGGSFTDTENGVFVAPQQTGEQSSKVTKIKATNLEGKTASAIVTIVQNSISVTPSFIFNKESNKTPIQINASSLYPVDKFMRSITPSNPEIYGTVDANGLYTPPNGSFTDGYSFAQIETKTSDGSKANTNVCLMSTTTKSEFNVSPPTGAVNAGGILEFSAIGDEDFQPSEWSLFPNVGVISVTNEGYTYKVKYVAPEVINSNETIFIHVNHKNRPVRAGYAVISLIAG